MIVFLRGLRDEVKAELERDFKPALVQKLIDIEWRLGKLAGVLPEKETKIEIKRQIKIQWGHQLLKVLADCGVDLSPLEEKEAYERFEGLYLEEE